jgi:hypothetical protein
VSQGSVALSRFTTAHPLYTMSTNRIGSSVSETKTTVRLNTRVSAAVSGEGEEEGGGGSCASGEGEERCSGIAQWRACLPSQRASQCGAHLEPTAPQSVRWTRVCV